MKSILQRGGPLLLLFLSACAASPTDLRPSSADDIIAPVEAIRLAADAAPDEITGRFGLRVQATGMAQGGLYLNSEEDYRDQRNLSIAINPYAQRQLKGRHGEDLQSFFRGKDILVYGGARRVRIDFTVGGRPSGKYYYQTHVRVTRAEQIQLVD